MQNSVETSFKEALENLFSLSDTLRMTTDAMPGAALTAAYLGYQAGQEGYCVSLKGINESLTNMVRRFAVSTDKTFLNVCKKAFVSIVVKEEIEDAKRKRALYQKVYEALLMIAEIDARNCSTTELDGSRLWLGEFDVHGEKLLYTAQKLVKAAKIRFRKGEQQLEAREQDSNVSIHGKLKDVVSAVHSKIAGLDLENIPKDAHPDLRDLFISLACMFEVRLPAIERGKRKAVS